MVEIGIDILKNSWGQMNLKLCINACKKVVAAGGTGLNQP